MGGLLRTQYIYMYIRLYTYIHTEAQAFIIDVTQKYTHTYVYTYIQKDKVSLSLSYLRDLRAIIPTPSTRDAELVFGHAVEGASLKVRCWRCGEVASEGSLKKHRKCRPEKTPGTLRIKMHTNKGGREIEVFSKVLHMVSFP
jgi:hypothetical protein